MIDTATVDAALELTHHGDAGHPLGTDGLLALIALQLGDLARQAARIADQLEGSTTAPTATAGDLPVLLRALRAVDAAGPNASVRRIAEHYRGPSSYLRPALDELVALGVVTMDVGPRHARLYTLAPS